MRQIPIALIILQAAASLMYAQSEPKKLSDVSLSIRTRSDQASFCIGEVIPLELSFTTSTENKYKLNTASYDHRGRLGMESFRVEPRSGWSDPVWAKNSAVGIPR
jgi:hypothetical protein